MTESRTRRLLHLILWRVFSSVRRLLVAPVLWLVLDDPTALPEIALALALGPLAAPLVVAEVLVFELWVWYVVAVAWVSDVVYFGYFDDVPRSWSPRAHLSTARRRLSSQWTSHRRAGVAVDGGQVVVATDLPSLDRLDDVRAAVTVRGVVAAVVEGTILLGYSLAIVVAGGLFRGLVLEGAPSTVETFSTWIGWSISYLWPLTLLFAAVLTIATHGDTK